MTLEENMLQWAEMQAEIDKLKNLQMPLEGKIKTAVLDLGETVKCGDEFIAQAKYSKGRGSYNWQNIAMRLEPEQEVIDKHSRVTVNWLKVCQAVGYRDGLKEEYYTPGTPSVSLKLL